MFNIDVVPTLTVSGSYTAGDFVGTSSSAMIFTGCSKSNGGTGYITGVTVVDYLKKDVAGELWVFDTNVTPPADNDAWTISDADSARLIKVIPINTYYDSALNSVSCGDMFDGNVEFKCLTGSTNLYVCFVTRGAPYYKSGDLTFRLYGLQD